MRADRGAQRAGAMAVDHERGVAGCEQALVEEAIDRRDRFVSALATYIDRRLDRTRGRLATRGYAIDHHDLIAIGFLGLRFALTLALRRASRTMRVHQDFLDRHERAHRAEPDLDLAIVRHGHDLATTEPRHDHRCTYDERGDRRGRARRQLALRLEPGDLATCGHEVPGREPQIRGADLGRELLRAQLLADLLDLAPRTPQRRERLTVCRAQLLVVARVGLVAVEPGRGSIRFGQLELRE
jgi:hypothetical protein